MRFKKVELLENLNLMTSWKKNGDFRLVLDGTVCESRGKSVYD